MITAPSYMGWRRRGSEGVAQRAAHRVMDVSVRELMNRALNDLSGLNGARHDRTLSHVRDLVKYGAAGLTGTHTALGALRADFVEAVWDDPERAAARSLRPSLTG